MTRLRFRFARFVAAVAAAGGLALAAPAMAQAIVTSPAPDHVAVTIYRAPGRPPATEMNLGWLEGYALITESRTVDIPAGHAVIRFEGVAGGILPESAIVTGLPAGVAEKNLDADLLSPGSLYARSLGRPVTVRRTIGDTTTEQRAIIRSGPDGAAILETKDGIEVADCGLPRDQLVYDSVPAGLSARPTLSVATDSPAAAHVTITLAYLAWGFDWQANYVATLRPDGAMDLFAWVTLANSDPTSFVAADTNVVAGRLNRETSRSDTVAPAAQSLEFRCYLTSRTPPPPPPPPPAPMMVPMEARAFSADIVVTGARKVSQEDLGDLKLYRVPEPTTVASLSQKQVALLDRASVPVTLVYRTKIFNDTADAVTAVLRFRNRQDQNLGLPLPAGPVAVFQGEGGRRLLVGGGAMRDKAVGEDVELDLSAATQVTADVDHDPDSADPDDERLTVTNANPFPIHYEAELSIGDDHKLGKTSARLERKNGHLLWAVDVPANASQTLRYRLRDRN